MTEYIVKFQETGPCEVDVEKVAKIWNDRFCISRWHDNYRLVEYLVVGKEECYKIEITQEQAQQIIKTVNLLPIQSSLFRFGITYRTESNIVTERDRLIAIVAEKSVEGNEKELKVLMEVVEEYNVALSKKANNSGHT